MKWTLLLFALLIPIGPPMPISPVTFTFRYPANELARVRFIAYGTQSLNVPLQQWEVLTNVAGTDVLFTGEQRNVKFSVSASSVDRFFVLAASNNVGVTFNK